MKGIYVLLIDVKNVIHVTVGKLGRITLATGLYAYVGSAQNSVEKRVERHLRKQKRIFWHIDYVLGQEDLTVTQVLYKAADKEEECRVAEYLTRMNEPTMDFGCSDCRCTSHLFRLTENPANLASLGFTPFMTSSAETKIGLQKPPK
jgi:Uri superfamily endonuclease